MKATILTIATALCLAATPAFAETIFSTDQSGRLVSFDTGTKQSSAGVITRYNNSTIALTDIALNSSGELYGVDL